MATAETGRVAPAMTSPAERPFDLQTAIADHRDSQKPEREIAVTVFVPYSFDRALRTAAARTPGSSHLEVSSALMRAAIKQAIPELI